MNLDVLYGEDVDIAFLEKLDPIDEACYERRYWGELKNTVDRYIKNPMQFVFVLDRDTDQLAGYLNFFPCEHDLYLDNLYRCPEIRDDDILPEEVAPWRTDENHVFIISLCVHPDYQGGEAIRLLTNSFVSYLNHLQDDLGYPITDIMGTTVSHHGIKALRNMLFRQLRTLPDGDIVCICDGKRLEGLLSGNHYRKTYRDDLYLLIPLAEHEDNLRLDALFEGGAAGNDDLAARMIDGLEEFIGYECSNEVASQIEFAQLGAFDFLHTTDDYEGPVFDARATDAQETADTYRWTSRAEYDPAFADEPQEVVMGDARGHVLLAAHRQTHMFVLVVMLPAYPFSTTQMEDQLSYGYLKMRDPKDRSHYVLLMEYLLKRYGLHACGHAKCVGYLDRLPDDMRELEDLLAAEAYDNVDHEYMLDSTEIKEMCATNRAQFDDYEVYLSSRAIVYVAHEWPAEVEGRVDDFSDYLFVVVMTLFQNTALAKVNMKVTRILEQSGTVSPALKLSIDREYGRTVRFWEMQNFKYLATQLESSCIKEAFLNQELRDVYQEHQEYLEHLVTVQTAIADGRNALIINILATMLAVVQIQPFLVDLMKALYGFLGIEAEYAESTINFGMFGGLGLFVLILWIVNRRSSHAQRRQL